MSEKQRWGKEPHLGGAVTANQADWCCDGVLGSRAVVSRGSSWRKGSLEQKESSLGSSGQWHISLKKPEIAQFHHLSDILMQCTACSVTFLCSVWANVLLLMLWFLRLLEPTCPHTAVTGDCTSVIRMRPYWIYLLLFPESPFWKNQLRNTV